MSYKKASKPVIKFLFIILFMYTLIYGAIFSLRIILAVDSPIVVVEGISMIPTYYDGDLLVIKGVTDKGTIEAFRDIVVFHSPADWNTLIVHRVISCSFTNDIWYFRTKGDNNSIPDGIISENNIVGVVIWRIPTIGGIILFTQSPIGRAILIIIIGVIVMDMFYNRDDKSFIKEKE